MMNDFIFTTNTTNDDYRVFSDDGREIGAENFERLYERTKITDDNGEFAAVFEEDGKIYLAAFNLIRGRKDRAGRSLRLSFCKIFPASEKDSAMRGFSRAVHEWDEMCRVAGELIEESPFTKKDSRGRERITDDVKFPHEDFLTWLTEKPSDPKIKRVSKNIMLRYSREAGEVETIRAKNYTLIITSAAVIVMICIAFILAPREEAPKNESISRETSRETTPRETKTTAADVTSPVETHNHPAETSGEIRSAAPQSTGQNIQPSPQSPDKDSQQAAKTEKARNE